MILGKLSAKKWLKELGKQSPELERIVKEINLRMRAKGLYEEFLHNPFMRDKKGPKFNVEMGDGDNLLYYLDEHSDDIKTIEDYFCGDEIIARTREGLQLSPDYDGPRIILLLDTNIISEWNKERATLLHKLTAHGAIESEIIPIINYEMNKGGEPHNITGNPAILAKNNNHIKKYGDESNRHQQDSIKRLFDIAEKEYKRIIEHICSESDRLDYRSTKDVAEVLYKNKAYRVWTEKVIKAYKEGNIDNYLPDATLATNCFCINLINRKDKCAVYSRDPDIEIMSQEFYNHVIPRYMANSILRNKKQRQKIFNRHGSISIIQKVKRHLATAQNTSSIKSVTIGCFYNAWKNKFHIKTAPESLISYFNGEPDRFIDELCTSIK